MINWIGSGNGDFSLGHTSQINAKIISFSSPTDQPMWAWSVYDVDGRFIAGGVGDDLLEVMKNGRLQFEMSVVGF